MMGRNLLNTGLMACGAFSFVVLMQEGLMPKVYMGVILVIFIGWIILEVMDYIQKRKQDNRVYVEGDE